MTTASLDKEPQQIAAMFDGVAKRYDLTNTIISMGQDRFWRRETRRALSLKPGERVLDLGAGTGVSTADLAKSGAYVVGVDLSIGMLRVGQAKRPEVPLLGGDALKLPFADETFDAATISLALRNIADSDAALREMARVTKPGGRLLVCEFSHPVWVPFRTAYIGYLMRALPKVARGVASNPDAYVYLAESIRAWPDQKGLAARIQNNGWRKVAWRNLSGGVVALHRGIRI
ncbi:demethylmenaquinone methyltransferase [Micromonospora andamanensis]|uniref:demethylmenaquinone methyltransferase n=1 Tax=Micromonospora andamanensis TaxID=1287068 RepID=UPI00194FB1EC|nr:demethylmenaquinone methyltransferase [Micromonospora andamanensis]GIJ41138.1 demethylmenaquinone methyltransferase [Micromonospora andamanensis]